jgi:hypothetical protein
MCVSFYKQTDLSALWRLKRRCTAERDRFGLDSEMQEADLNLILTSEKSVSLHLEKSNSFFGVWNVILFVISRNKRQ